MVKIIRNGLILGSVALLCGCPAMVQKQNAENPPAKIESIDVATPEPANPAKSAPSQPAQPAQPPIVATPTPPPAPIPPKYLGENNLVVLGAVEQATIEPHSFTMEARIDTGAATTSVNARDIVRFERDGNDWVKFAIDNGTKELILEQPITRTAKIKRHNAESQERYVITLWVKIGEIKEEIEVTLADRSKFTYPLLIGRNFLTDTAVVDVSRHHVTD